MVKGDRFWCNRELARKGLITKIVDGGIEMKTLKVLLLSACAALFAIGCGGTTAPPTDAELESMEAQMDADMEKMTGALGSNPDDPGAGKQPGGGAGATEAAPDGN